METDLVIPLVVALVGVVIAWKLLKGLIKTVVLVAILALCAWWVFGSGVLG